MGVVVHAPSETARDGVLAMAGAVGVVPAEALRLDRRTGGSGPTYLPGSADSVDLTEGVGRRDEGGRFPRRSWAMRAKVTRISLAAARGIGVAVWDPRGSRR